jgi:hypothetical protein
MLMYTGVRAGVGSGVGSGVAVAEPSGSSPDDGDAASWLGGGLAGFVGRGVTSTVSTVARSGTGPLIIRSILATARCGNCQRLSGPGRKTMARPGSGNSMRYWASIE